MASRDLNDLLPAFRAQVNQLLINCRTRGIEMRPYQTLRDPFEQARLWRQSRAREEIARKIAQFRAAEAEFLAFCLESVGPQFGDPVTNAAPGLSWHQWGEAVDCVWIVNGAAEWSAQRRVDGLNGFRVYAEEAQLLGLTPGGLWTRLKDWPHVQPRAAANPLGEFTLAQISATMQERFGQEG